MSDAGRTTTAELLGVDADARLLIVNCDDLGMYPAVNVAIVEAIEGGVATTCSLMTPCPAAAHAMELLRAHPEIPFGVHLTFVCDLAGHRWGPLSRKETVRSLLDGNGELFGWEQLDELLGQADVEELRLESRTQIEAVLSAGLEPTHLDWHCLHNGGRDDVFEAAVELAREYGLAVRASDGPARRLRDRGLPANDHGVLDSFELEVEGKSERYVEMLRELPRGLSHWAVHPGGDDDEARAVDPDGWRIRHSDHAFLTSPLAQRVLAEEKIVLLDYRRLQEVWRRA